MGCDQRRCGSENGREKATAGRISAMCPDVTFRGRKSTRDSRDTGSSGRQNRMFQQNAAKITKQKYDVAARKGKTGQIQSAIIMRQLNRTEEAFKEVQNT